MGSTTEASGQGAEKLSRHRKPSTHRSFLKGGDPFSNGVTRKREPKLQASENLSRVRDRNRRAIETHLPVSDAAGHEEARTASGGSTPWGVVVAAAVVLGFLLFESIKYLLLR